MPKSVKTQAETDKPQPEMVRVTISGTRSGVDQIIREFYLCRFSAVTDWTPPQTSPHNPNEVTSTYTRRLR
jgi:hypothetical protein